VTSKDAFPLLWPPGRPRTKYPKGARFAEIGFGRARDTLMAELNRLRATSPILSTNIPLKLDGMPYANRSQPQDKGVAVYFQYKKRPMVFACDEWDKIEHNVWAIAKTIEALRGIERWGSGDMLERAFTGFMSLPQPEQKKHWREILGFMGKPEGLRLVDVIMRRDELAMKHHPDRGGDGKIMAEINRAVDEALLELK
jgi:hypothetical protein